MVPIMSRSVSVDDEQRKQTKRIIEGMFSATTRSNRMSSLMVAAIAFDHSNTTAHDDEQLAGAAIVLSENLRAATQHRAWLEVERTCQILDMVFRCSEEVGLASFFNIGAKVLPQLIEIIVSKETKSDQVLKKSAKKVFYRLCSFEAPVTMIKNYSQLLHFLIKSMDGFYSASSVCAKTLELSAMLVLSNMSENCKDRSALLAYPGLIQTVINAAVNSVYDDTRVQAARILKNLAWDATNKSEMVQKDECLEAILKLINVSGPVQAKLYAMGAIKHLSAPSDNKIYLVNYREGAFLTAILGHLGERDSDGVRAEAMKVVINLLCRATAPIIGSHPTLLSRLARIGSGCVNEMEVEDGAMAIKKLSTYIKAGDRCHRDLLQVLVQLASTKGHSAVLWTAKAFAQQSKLPENRIRMVKYSNLLETLVELCRRTWMDVRTSALECVCNLAEDNVAAKYIVAKSDLLRLIVENASCDAENKARQNAVSAILCLASHRSAKIVTRVAKQRGLVASLSMYGTSCDTDVELKRVALHGVVLLAPYL